MNHNAKIIILRGNSGSGKTTVANRLQKELGRGTLLISQDVIRREMLWVKDETGTKALSLLINLVRYGKKLRLCNFVGQNMANKNVAGRLQKKYLTNHMHINIL